MHLDAIAEAVRARRTDNALRGRIKRALEPASSVPPNVRGFAALLEELLTEPEFQRSQYVAPREDRIAAASAALSPQELAALTRLLLPGIAGSVERAWTTCAQRPYFPGISRKPFRSPRSGEMQGHTRGRWLLATALMLGDYDGDIGWVAAHGAPLAGWLGGADLGWLLAGAIDAGGAEGENVFAILRASAAGEHETGQMGRHVIQALLSCSRSDAWEVVVKLLLAAQRQEGLRQAILESVDEAHPGAFRRMLQVIRDEKLARFSATVRAVDVWFGFLWDGASAIKVDDAIDRVARFLDDPAARAAAVNDRDAETAYLALWTAAFEDVEAAVPLAIPLLSAPQPERRFVATHFLVQSNWAGAMPALVAPLTDDDLRVARRALDIFAVDLTKFVDGARLFCGLEDLMRRVPRRTQVLPAIVWPWASRKFERHQVAAAMVANADAVSVERLLPYVRDLNPLVRAAFLRERTGVAARWAAPAPRADRLPLTPRLREFLLESLGDPSPDVRGVAFEALEGYALEHDEIARLTDLLGRTASDLRGRALRRLQTLGRAELLHVADALLLDAATERRVAGLELLRALAESGRGVEAVRERIENYAEGRSLSETERTHVEAVLGGGRSASLDDALGLVAPSTLRQPREPKQKAVIVHTPAVAACLEALAALVLEHQEVEVDSGTGERKLLIDAGQFRGVPGPGAEGPSPAATFPLDDVWRAWLASRDAAMRDPDGLELVRALLTERDSPAWAGPQVKRLVGEDRWSPSVRFLETLLGWCVYWERPGNAAAFLLDGFESSLARLTAEDLAILHEVKRPAPGFSRWGDWPAEAASRSAEGIHPPKWCDKVHWYRVRCASGWTDLDTTRLYTLLRWFQIQSRGYGGLTLSLELVVDAVRAGVADDRDFTDLLVGRWSRQPGLNLMRRVSGRKPPPELSDHPSLLAAVDRCRRRIVHVECQRGDSATAATPAAMDLHWSGGLETLSQALPALGSSKLVRNVSWLSMGSRAEALSHLILRSTPLPSDTPDVFAAWARRAKLPATRLIELAAYAPQWAGHVSHVLEWDGLEGAVWWLQAHTKDDRSWGLQELKEVWAAEVSERTPLSAADLMEGAVDVEWFRDVFGRLGPSRWAELDAAAKYAASSGGHTRAQLFARAIAGLVSQAEILGRIDSARHQDSVRALGLVPLGSGDDGRRDLVARYERLQTFRREARRFGSQRQQSEKRAVEIGLANLARTAGYQDPQRLQWAMEREALAHLLHGPVVVPCRDVTLTLSIDAEGDPCLTVSRGNKALAAVPASLRKEPAIAELRDRLQELRRQRGRVTAALEEAMCRGDAFSPAELRDLLGHPMLAPALSRLVLVNGDGVAGYPVETGHVLAGPEGQRQTIAESAALRIAHPHDLFAQGGWSAWQRDCFAAQRVQPFKQIFRELYPSTDAERRASASHRYAGHQINPRQGLSLLGGRGWVAHPEQGVNRTFHAEGLTARLTFQQSFYTPADIEGLTLEDVIFTKKGEWTALPIADVPPRLFSEAMRDLDLVVSVAHRGGVDPEASASTVEMRAALVRETCAALGLSNVEVSGHHAIVQGELARYGVHLGSANASVLPGTALFIVAVHSQHRGRLFLPFADDDPRTAEVMSKVLLLARDRLIKDPSILDQIRSAARG